MLRPIQIAALGVALAFAGQASAWRFIFIPGGLAQTLVDAATSSEGNNCVASTAKVGDTISIGSNRLTVKSLSGTSYRCTNPSFPIRALLVPIAQATSEARMDVPDGWTARQLTDVQKAGRIVLHAYNKTIDSHLMLATIDRSTVRGTEDYVKSRRAGNLSRLLDAKASDITPLTINGAPAWRYEVTGREKNVGVSYLFTVLEGDKEIVVASAFTSPANFSDHRTEFAQIADTISGLRAAAPTASEPPAAQGAEAAKP